MARPVLHTAIRIDADNEYQKEKYLAIVEYQPAIQDRFPAWTSIHISRKFSDIEHAAKWQASVIEAMQTVQDIVFQEQGCLV